MSLSWSLWNNPLPGVKGRQSQRESDGNKSENESEIRVRNRERVCVCVRERERESESEREREGTWEIRIGSVSVQTLTTLSTSPRVDLGHILSMRDRAWAPMMRHGATMYWQKRTRSGVRRLEEMDGRRKQRQGYVLYRYSIGIVSIFIVICAILSVQVFDGHLIGIWSDLLRSDRYLIGIVSVLVIYRHFIGISLVCYRYSIGIVSVFNRCFIVICAILSVQVFDGPCIWTVFDRNCFGILSVLYRQSYFLGLYRHFIGISSVSDRHCIGIVSVSVFFRHFIGILVVFNRYSIGIVSVIYRYLIVICVILSVQVFDWYLIGIASVCYRDYIDSRILWGFYRYFIGISSVSDRYCIGIVSV